MVSRTRLEFKVQYDHDLIEIFKKMSTRAYMYAVSHVSVTYRVFDYTTLLQFPQSAFAAI